MNAARTEEEPRALAHPGASHENRPGCHVVVTGSAGFVGQVLVHRLLRHGLGLDRSVAALTLVDLDSVSTTIDPRVRAIAGDLADPAVRQQAYDRPVDAVFHLASMPGGAAERDYANGRRINLEATLGLLEDLQGQHTPPRFVFASSVAVYGESLPAMVDEQTLPAPALSYGCHKLIGEHLVADATRRGWVHGCSLRLPGVVARPGDGAGMNSAFMSQLFWRLRDGHPLAVPVSPQATAWWISADACVDNLLQAAAIAPQHLQVRSSYQMPVLHLPVSTVVQALAARFGPNRFDLVDYQPDSYIERLFGNYPPLRTPQAEALGFASDGDVHRLVSRALGEPVGH